jgi:hypothetical protein
MAISSNDVKSRLTSFGYSILAEDDAMIGFCIEKVANTIKNDCNITDIPDGLYQIAIDMVCGEFLLSKKTFAPADIAGLDLDYAVKSIQRGDINTSFAVGSGSMTPEQRLDAFINYLLTYGICQFSSFRRFRW